MKRPVCNVCKQRLCAINYIRKRKTYYRTSCDHCIRAKKKIKPLKPKWQGSGYKKKSVCVLCGFRSLYPDQIVVFHVDNDLNNNDISNLRSVCLNCVIEIDKKELLWKQGDLIADF